MGNQISAIPLSQWESQGNVWPTKSGWYHMLRPDKLRNELLDADVAKQINGRWIIFPDAWQQYMAKTRQPRAT